MTMLFLLCSSCAYQWGYKGSSTKGSQVAVLSAENQSQVFAIEDIFSHALREELLSEGHVLVDKDKAQYLFLPKIENIRLLPVERARVWGNASSEAKGGLARAFSFVALYELKITVSYQIHKRNTQNQWVLEKEAKFVESEKYQSSTRILNEEAFASMALQNDNRQKLALKRVAKKLSDKLFDRWQRSF